MSNVQQMTHVGMKSVGAKSKGLGTAGRSKVPILTHLSPPVRSSLSPVGIITYGATRISVVFVRLRPV